MPDQLSYILPPRRSVDYKIEHFPCTKHLSNSPTEWYPYNLQNFTSNWINCCMLGLFAPPNSLRSPCAIPKEIRWQPLIVRGLSSLEQGDDLKQVPHPINSRSIQSV